MTEEKTAQLKMQLAAIPGVHVVAQMNDRIIVSVPGLPQRAPQQWELYPMDAEAQLAELAACCKPPENLKDRARQALAEQNQRQTRKAWRRAGNKKGKNR
jgi:hypothetical protein